MSAAQGMLRFVRLCLFLVGLAFCAPHLFAQESDSLSRERMLNLMRKPLENQEELNLGGRMLIESASYNQRQVAVVCYVDWRDGTQLITNIDVSVSMLYAGEKDKTFELPSLRGRASTDRNGRAVVMIPIRSSQGLLPGEYFIKLELFVGGQSEAIQNAMMRDPKLFGFSTKLVPDLDEEGKQKRDEQGTPMNKAIRVPITDPEHKQSLFKQLRLGQASVPAVLHKLYVAEDTSWMDNGSLAAWQEIMSRIAHRSSSIRKVEDIERRLKGMGKDDPTRAETDAELELARRAVEQISALLELGGGEPTADEDHARKNAEANKERLQHAIAAFKDRLVWEYLGLIEGDFGYWRWKIVSLYGTSVYDTIKSGKLPWEALAASGEKDAPVDEAAWKTWLKQQLTIKVKGDPATFKDATGKLPAGVKNELRGGAFSDLLYERMLQDIDAFSIMAYLEKTADGYAMNEEAWREFEASIRIAMGLDPSRASEALVFKAFAFQGGELSTADRLHELDLAKAYGIDVTCYPLTHSYVQSALQHLSYLPVAYRHQYYVNKLRLTGRALQEKQGSELQTPSEGRRKTSELHEKYVDALKQARSALGVMKSPIYRLWNFQHGPKRNIPKKQRDEEIAQATKDMERRFSSKVLPGNPDDSDIIIEEAGGNTDNGGEPGR